MIKQLIPDDILRNYISRTHFELSREGSMVLLQKLSSNLLLVDDMVVPALKLQPLADNSRLSLCGPDATCPFLTLRVRLDGLLLPEKESTAIRVQASPPQEIGPPLVLSCTYALGKSASESMQELQTIDVPRGATLVIGRQRQPEFFDAVLGQEQRFLNYVSRSHLELVPLPSGQYRMTNWSLNPVVVEGNQLERGHQCIVFPPAGIEFVAGDPGSPSAVVYLRLRLEHVHSVAVADVVSAA